MSTIVPGPILNGQAALVTGASSGIGAAIALAFAQAGARVGITTQAAPAHRTVKRSAK